jgi:predicted Rossmann-fold nucleotide-binding protein
LLNVENYYSPLLEMFDHAVAERFLKSENRGIVLSHTRISGLVTMMEQWRPVTVEKWLDASTR